MPEHSHAYKMLENFHREMRMVHIYQPAMLMKLLKSSGEAKIREIAKFLLSHNQSQIEHYEQITKNMVGRVPTKTRGLTERIDDVYRLKGFEDLPSDEIKDLVSLCQENCRIHCKAWQTHLGTSSKERRIHIKHGPIRGARPLFRLPRHQ
jgi:hypothetical protein